MPDIDLSKNVQMKNRGKLSEKQNIATLYVLNALYTDTVNSESKSSALVKYEDIIKAVESLIEASTDPDKAKILDRYYQQTNEGLIADHINNYFRILLYPDAEIPNLWKRAVLISTNAIDAGEGVNIISRELDENSEVCKEFDAACQKNPSILGRVGIGPQECVSSDPFKSSEIQYLSSSVDDPIPTIQRNYDSSNTL